MNIFPAATEADYRDFADLIREYTDWCRERYAEVQWFVAAAFGHQSLEQEMLDLPAKYGPPDGLALLARDGQDIVGCGAYRRTGPSVCEMKRVFVPDRHKGKGIGRRLCEDLITSARDKNYRRMQLDTTNRMTEAIALYRSLGFVTCAPYQHYPEELMPYMVFMEKALDRS